MLNRVGPVFVGNLTGAANTGTAISSLIAGDILMFKLDHTNITAAAVSAVQDEVYLINGYGAAKPIIVGPIKRKNITKYTKQAYAAAALHTGYLGYNESSGDLDIADDSEYQIVIVFQDDLRLLPNKQTRMVIHHKIADGVTGFSAEMDKIVTKINADLGAPYVTASNVSTSDTVLGIKLVGKSIAAKSIDKYENVTFTASISKVGTQGEITDLIADLEVTQAASKGSGLPKQVRELEFNAQGWLGVTDLRDFIVISGNPAFRASDSVTGSGYVVYHINYNEESEGDMQQTRTRPCTVTVAIATASTQATNFETVMDAFVAGTASSPPAGE